MTHYHYQYPFAVFIAGTFSTQHASLETALARAKWYKAAHPYASVAVRVFSETTRRWRLYKTIV